MTGTGPSGYPDCISGGRVGSRAMKKTLMSAAAAALLVGLFCGPSLADKAVPRQNVRKPAATSAGVQPTAVFDLGHSEIFSPLRGGPMNYTSFYDLLKLSGEEVGVNRGPVTSAALAGVRTYIIAGPAHPFSAPEITAIEAFVRDGGNLLVLLHISGPVAALTNAFGIAVSNFTICEAAGAIDGDARNFFVTGFAVHPVTEGMERLAVFGTWGLLAEEGALVVASTPEGAWADIDRDRRPGEGEPVQAFGIVAVSQLGSGKVVVVADDAPFANRFITEADNRRLAENILRWFGSRP